MIELNPFDKGKTTSRKLFEVYETRQTSKNHKDFTFLGYVLKDGKDWLALTRKKNTPDTTHQLRRDAIAALQ